jgi:hypothetical protein
MPSKCPYKKNVLCAYLENYDDTTVYVCESCPHYRLNYRVVPPEPPLAKKILHALIAIVIIGVLYLLYWAILNHFRP